MAHTLLSSNEQQHFASKLNLDDSTSSSDAGSVLIRSTRINFPERSYSQHGEFESVSAVSNKPENVQITVKKLSNASQYATDEVPKSRRSKKQEYVSVPPALKANLPSSASATLSGNVTDGHRVPKGQAVLETSSGPQKKSLDPHRDKKETKLPSTQLKSRGVNGHEVLISRFTAGGKGAILAALKQRSQSAPLRREVKVQLLGQRPAVQSPEHQPGTFISGKQGPGQTMEPQPGPLPCGNQEPGQILEPQPVALLSGHQGATAACTAAVVTAATIAATAPLLKAQSDMEMRVSQMSEGLKRLLEADRHPGQPQESRGGREVSYSREGSRTMDRVAQLEQQLSSLTQQRLKHLEQIQNQQMELQSRLLESALSVVTSHSSVTPTPLLGTDPMLVPGPGSHPGLSGPQPTGYSQTHLAVVNLSSDTDQPSQRGFIGDGGSRSPLETPAPRRVIPKPTHWTSSTQNAQKPQTRTQRSTRPGSRTDQVGPRSTQNISRPESSRQTPGSGSKVQRSPSSSQGSGKLLEAIRDNRRSGSWAARARAQVAVATAHDDVEPPEQFRDNQQPQGAFGVSTVTPDQLPSSAAANHSDVSAVQRANQMLKDLGRLKTEMHTLLTTRDALPGQMSRETAQLVSSSPSSTRRPPAAPTTTTTTSSTTTTTTLPPSLPLPPPVSMPSPKAAGEMVSAAGPPILPLPAPPLLQRTPLVPSMFEDAEKVLRRVQRHRKVLEENLQAMLRANEGEVLHCQLEALANNRDTTEEVRIKKTVDAWIKSLSKGIQTEATEVDLAAQRRPSTRERGSVAPAAVKQKTSGTRDGRGKTLGMPRTAGNKSSGKVSRGHLGGTEEPTKPTLPSAKQRPAQHMQNQSQVTEEEEEARPGDEGAGEDYLVKLYGKALYEGHRRTLKKGPYLRFSSPSPRSKGPRPRVVESVKGVKMKSSKTQTNLPPDPAVSSPQYPSSRQAQYIFSPTRGGLDDLSTTPLEGYLLPIAIPLGQPRVDGVAPQPSRVIISNRPIIVTTSLPPSPPRPPPAPRKPTVTLLEVKSDQRKRPAQLTVQVQPSVNIEPSTLSPVPPSSLLPTSSPSPIQTVEETEERRKESEEEEEEEENVFPGSNFLAVADISQQPEEDSEDLDGGTGLDGPEPVLRSILHRDAMETRLADWVDQQLMARLNPEMQTVQSEPEEMSATSDTVDTAGGEGQRWPGANANPEEIRQYINEAVTEIITQMLGQRDGQTQGQEQPAPPTQDPPPSLEKELVPTPMPTPEPSASPVVPSRGPSPLGTPQSSDQGSPEQTPRDTQPDQPQTSTPTEPEPVVTPASTPAPTPPKLTPLPPLEPQSERYHPWGDAELPLDEEQPHNHSLEINKQPGQPLVMSVAVEEPLLVSPPPVTPTPQPARSPTPPPAPLPGPETPSLAPSSSTEDSTSSSSSSTVSGTDTAVKHISEGELLISYNQLVAAQTYEEGICLPYEIYSFSSSLHEVQDMDYDPPSEGQVRRPQVPPHHDPLLSLLAKMDQGVVSTLSGPVNQPGGSWELGAEEEVSVGEVSEGQRPRLTLAGERIMTGHSLLGPRSRTTGSRIYHPPRTTDPRSRAEARTTGSTEARQGQMSSPGQLNQSADVTELTLGDTHQGPVTIGDLGVEPAMSSLASHFQTDSSQSPPPPLEDPAPLGVQAGDWFSALPERPAPILVKPKQEETHSGDKAQGVPRVMAVHLPSAGQEEEEMEGEVIEEEASISLGALGGADSDSSGNDVF